MPYDKKNNRGDRRYGVPRAVRDDAPRGGYRGDAGRSDRGRKPYGETRGRSFDDKPRYGEGKGRSFGDKPRYGEGKGRSFGDKPRYGEDRGRSFGDKPRYGESKGRSFGDKPRYGEGKGRPFGDKPRYGEGKGRPFGDRPRVEARGERPYGDRPRYDDKPRAPRPPRPRMDSPFDDPAADPLARYMIAPAPAEENALPENMLVGRNPIREAIKAGRDIEKLMVARGDLSGSAREIIAKAHEAGIVVQEVDRTRLDALYKGHQGMIAFASAANYADIEEIFDVAAERDEDPFIVVLDGITDPHNLGAIIRTAECAGAHGVIIPQRRGVGLTPAAVKASAGACEYVKVARVTNINRMLEQLKERGLWVIASSMDGEDVYQADLTGPVALVIGAEGEGISELTEKKCDMKLKLPMLGHIDSLNASVAAGLMMYAVLNARRA